MLTKSEDYSKSDWIIVSSPVAKDEAHSMHVNPISDQSLNNEVVEYQVISNRNDEESSKENVIIVTNIIKGVDTYLVRLAYPVFLWLFFDLQNMVYHKWPMKMIKQQLVKLTKSYPSKQATKSYLSITKYCAQSQLTTLLIVD